MGLADLATNVKLSTPAALAARQLPEATPSRLHTQRRLRVRRAPDTGPRGCDCAGRVASRLCVCGGGGGSAAGSRLEGEDPAGSLRLRAPQPVPATLAAG